MMAQRRFSSGMNADSAASRRTAASTSTPPRPKPERPDRSAYVGLDNFYFIFNDPLFWDSFRQADNFLMDEPLSSLDAKLRVTMRGELRRFHMAPRRAV
jgi:hypothetical protein